VTAPGRYRRRRRTASSGCMARVNRRTPTSTTRLASARASNVPTPRFCHASTTASATIGDHDAAQRQYSTFVVSSTTNWESPRVPRCSPPCMRTLKRRHDRRRCQL
jgi:hypothetical protein